MIKLAILVGGASLLLADCDVAPSVEVRNDLGKQVLLHLPTAGRYGRPRDISLDQGKGRVFNGDALDANSRYAVRFGGCEYVFEYPHIVGLNHVGFIEADGSTTQTNDSFPLTIQLEPDFRLYLLAPGRLQKGVGRPDPTPAHGFPMSPISGTCSRQP